MQAAEQHVRRCGGRCLNAGRFVLRGEEGVDRIGLPNDVLY